MNTGQTLLTLAALILLSGTVLNFNRSLNNSDLALAQSRYRLEALSLLSSHMEQASQNYFDEATLDSTSAKTLGEFTAPGILGLEINDLGVPDDFDDFNGMAISDTGRSGVPYRIYFEVDYVRLQGDSFVVSGNREYHKRMRISVMDDYPRPILFKYQGGAVVRDTMRMEFVYSYWFYN
ncbi:MAG: hypothetical protein KDI06_17680 [Calditrichaeota bacterium]|nr:hypothetical protein [Calditrichota bacterium]